MSNIKNKNMHIKNSTTIKNKYNNNYTLMNFFYDTVLVIFIIALIAFVNVRPFFQLVQYIFIVLYLMRFIQKDYKLSSYTLWSVLFSLTAFSSIFIAQNQSYTFSQSISVVQPLIFCNLLIPFMLEKNRNYELVINSLIVAAIVLLLRLYVNVPLYLWGTSRLGNEIGYNANTIGLVLSFTSILSYYQYHKSKSYLYLISFGLLGFASFFSGSRKAIALVVLGYMLLTIMTIDDISKFVFSMITLIIFSFLVYYLITTWAPLYNVLGKRVESLIMGILGGDTDSSTSTRFDMIKSGLVLFKQKPIFGYGLGNYRFVSIFSTYAHNNYIEILVSFGLFGTIIYYSLYLSLFFKGIKSLIKTGFKNNPAQLTCLIVGIILVMEIGMVSYYDEFFQLLLAVAFVSLNKNTNKDI